MKRLIEIGTDTSRTPSLFPAVPVPACPSSDAQPARVRFDRNRTAAPKSGHSDFPRKRRMNYRKRPKPVVPNLSQLATDEHPGLRGPFGSRTPWSKTDASAWKADSTSRCTRNSPWRRRRASTSAWTSSTRSTTRFSGSRTETWLPEARGALRTAAARQIQFGFRFSF